MSQVAGLHKVFDEVMKDLLDSVHASRTTLRIDLPSESLTLDVVSGEATALGISSLKGSTSIQNVRSTVRPVQFLEQTHEILVQEDCTVAEPAPPASLIENYGVKAQMLGPIIYKGELVGVISVHYNDGPRKWSQADIVALQNAVSRLEELVFPSPA